MKLLLALSRLIDKLNDLVKKHPPYADALAAAPLAEILLGAMIEFYGERNAAKARGKDAAAPSAEKMMRPKVLRNALGKPVSVKGWLPKRVP